MRAAIRVRCVAHDTVVVPAGEQLHMIPDVTVDGRLHMSEWHEIGLADTWCPVSSHEGVEHRYSVDFKVQED